MYLYLTPAMPCQGTNIPYVVSETPSDEGVVFCFAPRADGVPIEDTEPDWARRAGPRLDDRCLLEVKRQGQWVGFRCAAASLPVAVGRHLQVSP